MVIRISIKIKREIQEQIENFNNKRRYKKAPNINHRAKEL